MMRIRLAVLVVFFGIVGLVIRLYIVHFPPAPMLSNVEVTGEVGQVPDIAGVYRLQQGEARGIDGVLLSTYSKGKLIIVREEDCRCSWVEGLTVQGVGTTAFCGEYSYEAGQWKERENSLLRTGNTLVISEVGANFTAQKIWVRVADDFVADKYVEKKIADQIAFLNSDGPVRAFYSLGKRKRVR